MEVKGKAAFVLKEKLKILKGNLRSWNINVFDILDLEVEGTFKEINGLQHLVTHEEVKNEIYK